MTTVGSGLQILGESGEHARELEAKVVSLKIVDGVVNSPCKDAFGSHFVPLTNITNRGNDTRSLSELLSCTKGAE